MSAESAVVPNLREVLLSSRRGRTPLTPSLSATLAWAAIAMLVQCSLLIATDIGSTWFGWPDMSVAPSVHLQLLLYGITAVIVVVAVRSAGANAWDYLALTRPTGRDVLRGVGWGLGAFAVVLIVLMVCDLFGVVIGSPTTGTWASAAAMDPIDKFALSVCIAFLTVVVGPGSEEMLFRGLLYRGLAESRIGAVGAVLVTALAFGLTHKLGGSGWDRVVTTTAGGLLLGFLRLRTGGLTIPMITHAAYNSPIAMLGLIDLARA